MSTSSLDQSVYGALYFATVISTALYGVTCMQTFFFYIHYQNDPLRTKNFVAIIWALNTVHDALVISGTYKYIMAGIVNPLSISDGISEFFIQTLFTVLVAIPTQGFFVYRIYLFSGKNIVAPLIWVPLAIYQLVYTGKALYIAHGIHVLELSALGDDFFMDLSISSLSVGAAVDVLVAVFLVLLILRERSAVTFPRAANILQRLVVFAVNTGIWSAIFALLTLILLRLYPHKSIYSVFGIPLCSVYCNTLLANLNARLYIRGDVMTSVDMDLRVLGGSSSAQQSGETKLIHVSECLERHRGVTSSNANLSAESENV